MTILKILIADDNADYRNSIARAVFQDYETDFASNADEMIEKAKQNRYLLILTDNQMEDGYGDSGIYAIRQIRKFDSETPIFLHTSDLTDEIRDAALASGANEVFKKTTRVQELKDKVRVYAEK